MKFCSAYICWMENVINLWSSIKLTNRQSPTKGFLTSPRPNYPNSCKWSSIFFELTKCWGTNPRVRSYWYVDDVDHPCHPWVMALISSHQVPPKIIRWPTKRLVAADKWMVTIIHLSPGSTQPEVHKIRSQLGGPSHWSFPLEFKVGWPILYYVGVG